MIAPRKIKRKKEDTLTLPTLEQLDSLLEHPPKISREQQYEAQDLLFEAYDSRPEKAAGLLTRACQIDPMNIDIHLHMMEFFRLEPEEAVEILLKLIQIGAKRLGSDRFKNDKGHFWPILETRPYMKARAALVGQFLKLGRIEEAIKEQEEMLELNPNDNQGIRYDMLACCMAAGKLDKARKLFEDFKETAFNVSFSWFHVLERYIAGDMEGAKQALGKARKQNRFMEPYLLGSVKPIENKADMYTPGSADEAGIHADMIVMAWSKYPEAVEWLKSQNPM
ncbi:MAG: tetratricopeptide repeat protein [Victivallales bacterium]